MGIPRLYGKTSGLARNEIGGLEKLYRRKIPVREIITLEFARALSRISHQIKKEVSILIDRKGRVRIVFLGDSHELPFDELLGRSRESKYRLRGFRLIYADPKNGVGFNQYKLVTLLNERLDMMALLEVSDNGTPGKFHLAYILPKNSEGKKWEINKYRDLGRIDVNCDELIREVEHRLERSYYEHGGEHEKEGVVLVGFSVRFRSEAEESLKELRSLAISANKVVLHTTIQTRKNIDPRYLIGKGKLNEVILSAKHVGAEKIIFDVELSPAQVKAIVDETDLDVMDRAQLILEIFARHATTSEGKLQVRLAQLRYNLPRLVGRGADLSQLGGGIGTRGPGEKKLEEERRKIKKQIEQLEKQITSLSRRRELTRKRRRDTGIPTVTLIGYTNAGKSTLFNTLTNSGVVVKNKLFSTLIPTTRKLKLPSGRNILVTDTVGFINDLPKELVNAFRATLEELGASSLFLHVSDASDPMVEEKIEAVEKILESKGHSSVPRIILLNKADNTPKDIGIRLSRIYKTPLISACDKDTLPNILDIIDETIFNLNCSPAADYNGETTFELNTVQT